MAACNGAATLKSYSYIADYLFASMDTILRDNWDQHWADFANTSERAPATRYRTRLALEFLQIHDSRGPVHLLDIGSGHGSFAADVLSRYPDVQYTGIEMSSIGIAIASRNAPAACFLQRNLLVPVKPGDVPRTLATHAVCSEVFEHLDQPQVLVRNACHYLAPGCRLVVTVPGGPMSEFDRHIGHRRHYDAVSLRHLLESAGFAVEQVVAAGFPFFNLYRLGVVLRGKRLVDDLGSAGTPPLHVRAGMLVFDALFRLNLQRWGWQMLAVARWPGNPTAR